MEAENTGGVSPSWPVEGIVAEGSSTSWTGDRWSHKSLLALHLGLSVAAPGIGEWMGQRVRTSPVIYVDFNGSIESFCHRAVAVAEGLGLDSRSPTLGDFHYLGRLPPGGPLSSVDALARAARGCERIGAGLVIIEWLGAVLGFGSGGSSLGGGHRPRGGAWDRAAGLLSPLKASGAGLLLVDPLVGSHGSAAALPRALYGSEHMAGSFRVRWTDDEGKGLLGSGRGVVTLTHEKNDHGPLLGDLRVRVAFGGDFPAPVRLRPERSWVRAGEAPSGAVRS